MTGMENLTNLVASFNSSLNVKIKSSLGFGIKSLKWNLKR